MSVQTGTKRKEGGFAETVRVVFHALIIALVIRTFLFQPFNICFSPSTFLPVQ